MMAEVSKSHHVHAHRQMMGTPKHHNSQSELVSLWMSQSQKLQILGTHECLVGQRSPSSILQLPFQSALGAQAYQLQQQGASPSYHRAWWIGRADRGGALVVGSSQTCSSRR